MRWIGCLVVAVCLLFAGGTPARSERDRDRPDDELTAVTTIAKLTVRRQDGARTHGVVGLGSLALVAIEPLHAPPRAAIDLAFAVPAARAVAVHAAAGARGPPLG